MPSDTIEHEPETIAPEESLSDSIRASFREVTGAPETPEPEAPQAETETERADRLRDERGRFAKAAEEAAETPAEPEAPEAAEAPAEAAKPAIEPHPNWPADFKAEFATLPPAAQKVLLDRYQGMEADYTRKTMQIAAFRRDFEPVAQMFEPHRDVMRQKGFTPAGIIKGYVETEGGLMDPQRAPETAARIIKAYQINPQDVMRALGVTAPAQGDAAPVPDGQPAAPNGFAVPPELLAYIQGVGNEVNTLKQQQERERAWQLEQAQSRVMSEIDKFAKETGPDGRPLRPYFAEVEDDMAELAQIAVKRGGDTPPLHELYETAVYANPVTRARVLADQTAALEAQRKAQEAQRVAEARAKAAKAQRASTPVSGAPRSGPAAASSSNASVIDDLRETLAERRN